MTRKRNLIPQSLNDSAKLLKVTSVLLFSLMPLVWEKTIQQGRPFTFTGWLLLSWALAVKITLSVLRKKSRFREELNWYECQSFGNKYGSRWWGLQNLGTVNLLLYMMALPTIGAAAVTLLYESWSFFFIVLSPYLAATFNKSLATRFKRSDLTIDWTTQTRSRWIIISFVVPGIYLIVSSLSTGETVFDLQLSVDFTFSIVLVLLASIMTAIATSSKAIYGRHALGGFYSEKSVAKDSGSYSVHSTRIEETSALFAMRGDYLCMLAAALLFLLIGLLQDNATIFLSLRESLGILIGTVIWIAAELCLQYSLQATDDPSITTISHLGPVFTLIFLGLFANILVYSWIELLVGGAIVVSTNMLLHLDPEGAETLKGLSEAVTQTCDSDGADNDTMSDVIERREDSGKPRGSALGHRALTLALSFGGTVLVFRSDWLPKSWMRVHGIEYWGALATAVTFFALLVSFRLTRLHETNRYEEEKLLGLIRLHEKLRLEGVLLDDVVLDAILQMDEEAYPSELSEHYFEAWLAVDDALERVSSVTSDDLRTYRQTALMELGRNLDEYVLGRQSSRGYAELAVLVLLSASIVFVSLFVPAYSYGAVSEMAGFAIDLVCMAVGAAVVFLTVGLIDQQHYRDAPTTQQILSPVSELDPLRRSKMIRLNLLTAGELRKKRRIVSILGMVVFGFYGFAIYSQWMDLLS